MGPEGRSRAVETQIGNEDQPQLARVVEIAELRQIVQQQSELMRK